MFKIGDIISVSKKGICRVEDIAKNVFEGCDKAKTYYVLRPLGGMNNMVVYFPTDSSVKMRKIVTKSVALDAFENICADQKLSGENGTIERVNEFGKLISDGEFENWTNVLCTLSYLKNTKSKKNFGALDQKQLSSVFELVCGEVSAACGKDLDDVRQNLKQKLGI